MRLSIPINLILIILLGNGALAQQHTLYQKNTFVKNGDSLPYRILLPKNYDSSKTYPLILVLHGAGERGSDNESQLVHGANLFLKEEVRDEHHAIVVFPQCAIGSSWAKVDVKGNAPNREFVFHQNADPTIDMLLLEGLLQQLKKTHKIDKKRIYVGGLSMGGMGTFELVRRNPRMFAAAFPICGGANPKIYKKLSGLDWWVFHGEADRVVPEKCSATMVYAMRNKGINVKYSLYPGVGHNSWDNAFSEPDLLTWLFSKSR
ncbi:MAG: alpha/beta hydrolase-fold protein [Flavobacteriaceae bacterium]